MTTLDAQALARYAAAAGASGNALATAVAVALAESGGQVEIVSKKNKDGTYDRGPWQINDVHTQYDRARLVSDPGYNASAAAEVSSGWTNFHPWTTFNTGAYKKYLGDAQAAAGAASSSAGHLSVSAGGIGLPNPIDVATAPLNLLSSLGISNPVTGWVADLGATMISAFLVIVFTIAAFALIGLGLGRLTGRNPVDVFKKISSTTQSATTVAAAAAI